MFPISAGVFVPQVLLNTGNFFWLSGTRPIVAPGTPFALDLQSWTRDAMLDPDWLRVGMDVVGGTPAPTFNVAFSLSGETTAVPEPSALALLSVALAGLGFARRRRLRQVALKALRNPACTAGFCLLARARDSPHQGRLRGTFDVLAEAGAKFTRFDYADVVFG